MPAPALGRQELLGEIVDEQAGSLWRRDWIEGSALRTPELGRIVVAVDPPVTATASSDACGIIVAGLGADGRAYIAADRSLRARAAWCGRGRRCGLSGVRGGSRRGGSERGGDLVVLGAAADRRQRGGARRRATGASGCARSRSRRSMRRAVWRTWACCRSRGQMLAFGPMAWRAGAAQIGRALVWALTDLMLGRVAAPGIRQL